MEYSHAPRWAENRSVLYLGPCFVFTLSLEIASLEIFFIGRSPLVQCSLAVCLDPLFLPASSAMLDRSGARALCVVGLPTVRADPTCPVECIISDVVFQVFLQYTDYSVDSLLVLNWRWLSHTRILHGRSSPLPKFCGLSAVLRM